MSNTEVHCKLKEVPACPIPVWTEKAETSLPKHRLGIFLVDGVNVSSWSSKNSANSNNSQRRSTGMDHIMLKLRFSIKWNWITQPRSYLFLLHESFPRKDFSLPPSAKSTKFSGRFPKHLQARKMALYAQHKTLKTSSSWLGKKIHLRHYQCAKTSCKSFTKRFPRIRKNSLKVESL